ncbi:MAG: hypothetical protein CMP91_13295 [Gammaproteobacteria bacterium]|nr:hypothetical protein [Gammaproteobacteria bacterium]MAY02039.1 hypothetical protein [Gammaproteobacteria bacterium]|tara:strand:+ start:1813 stop:2208 length:396 start_codon:yes stop_codon:yes gene_type:complete
MFIKFMSRLIAILLLPVMLNAAESTDLTGTWSGSVRLANGNELPFIAVLEQDGESVSGILEGIGGAPDVTIMNGRIENDTVRFAGIREIQGEDVRFDYIGTYVGDYINFTIIRVGATGANSVLNTMTTRQP